MLERYTAKLNDPSDPLTEATVIFRRHLLPTDITALIEEDNEETRHALWLSERGIVTVCYTLSSAEADVWTFNSYPAIPYTIHTCLVATHVLFYSCKRNMEYVERCAG